MDYLNKFRSTMNSVVVSVSNALPGNPLIREFEIGDQIASAGLGLFWRIYRAKKKSTGQSVAVWLFEKRDIDRWPKIEKEMFVDLLKRGIAQLTKLRHPRLLVIERPLEESRDSLAFCTEPIFACLANCLGRIDNMPGIIPSHLDDFQLLDLEIKHGLFQLVEALAFLHMDGKMLHRNVVSESVLINTKGAWKLAGFEFANQGQADANGHLNFDMLDWSSSLMPCVQPNLDYMAPEYLVGGRCDSFSDIYSLGVLSFALYNKGRPLFEHRNNISTFKSNTKQLKVISLKHFANLPDNFREDIKMALNFTPDLRPDATQFSKIAYFDDTLVKTLNYFESLCQMDSSQKIQFFKELHKLMCKFPKRPLLQKVLPFLFAEFSNPDLIQFILPCIFLISEQAFQTEFSTLILPHLIPVFSMQKPYQIALMLLQKMELLLEKTPNYDIKKHVLPLIYNALTSDTTKIQELCLGIIPTISKFVDRDSMKSQLLPKLLNLATEAGVLSVRVQSLLCIGKLLNHLESWMVTEQILPSLSKIHSKEPGVLMAVLGIYKMSFENNHFQISKDQCAKSALPYLIANSVENSLNLGQFVQFNQLIRKMFDKVELEQKTRLGQLSALQEEQRSVSDFSQVIGQTEARKQLPKCIDDLAGLYSTDRYIDTDSIEKSNPVVTPLSLAEKKRLAAEQEHNIRSKTQSSLTPIRSTTNQEISKQLNQFPLSTSIARNTSNQQHDTNNTMLFSTNQNPPLLQPIGVVAPQSHDLPKCDLISYTSSNLPHLNVDLSEFDTLTSYQHKSTKLTNSTAKKDPFADLLG